MANYYQMSESKSAQGMAEAIRTMLINQENMTTQIVRSENGEYLVQAKASNVIRTVTGTEKVINVKITPAGNSVYVEVGSGKWIDKGVASVIGWFLFWPLSITSVVGAVNQGRLPGKVYSAAAAYAA